MYFHWRIEMIKLQNGERFPLLIDKRDKMPAFNPTVYTTTMVRAEGRAESTTNANLRAIMFLYSWGIKHGIDVEARFKKGAFLTLTEIENLSAEVHLRYEKLHEKDNVPYEFGEKKNRKTRKKRANVVMLRAKAMADNCEPQAVFTRFRYIRDYLDWLASQRMGRVSQSSSEYVALHLARENMKKEIDARIPESIRGIVRDPLLERMGLSHEVEDILFDVLKFDNPRNPFKHKHTRVRNELLVKMVFHTGIRRGECLGIRNTDNDLDLQRNTVTIHRVPLDPLDSRLHKPQTKTRPRQLPIGSKLSKCVRDYRIKHRQKMPTAGTHPFLFVSSKTGLPLSLAAVNDIFEVLRNAIPELPRNFSPHFGRYTWNDRFSEEADEKIRLGKWTVEQEREARCLQMGWSENSMMAALYAKRHNKYKADEFSLKRQEQLFKKDAD